MNKQFWISQRLDTIYLRFDDLAIKKEFKNSSFEDLINNPDKILSVSDKSLLEKINRTDISIIIDYGLNLYCEYKGISFQAQFDKDKLVWVGIICDTQNNCTLLAKNKYLLVNNFTDFLDYCDAHRF